jgi:type II secretory pathway component PulC
VRLRGLPLYKTILLLMPVAYGVFVTWQEWSWRKNITLQVRAPASTAAPIQRESLDATAIATVLGLTQQTALLPSAEPLTLHASFVASDGLSRALLADARGSRIYQVGEELPGGSVLRRVEVHQVVLWSKGREELLTLQPSTSRFLRRFEPSSIPVSSRFLRPFSGQLE